MTELTERTATPEELAEERARAGYYLDDDGVLKRRHDLFGGPHDEPPRASGEEE